MADVAIALNGMLKTSHALSNPPRTSAVAQRPRPLPAVPVLCALRGQAQTVAQLCDIFRAHLLGQEPLPQSEFLARQDAFARRVADLSHCCCIIDLIQMPSLVFAADVLQILSPLYRPDLDQYLAAYLLGQNLRPMSVVRLQNTALAVAQRAVQNAHRAWAQCPDPAWDPADDLAHCARMKQALSHRALNGAIDGLMDRLRGMLEQRETTNPAPGGDAVVPQAPRPGPPGLPPPPHGNALSAPPSAPLAALEVPARWASVALGTAVCGKVKGPAVLYQGLDLGRDRPSTLYDAEGWGVTMLSTAHRGAYGNVSFGVSENGLLVAIKKTRHVPKPAHLCKPGRKLNAVSAQRALLEFQWTQQARAAIERAMAPLDALPEQCPGSLRRLRSGVQPYVGYAFVEDPAVGKSYAVMSKEAGDLRALQAYLDGPHRFAAALSLAAQGYSELEVLHSQVRLAHLDLSMENILFSGTGQMKLLDFGASCCVDDWGVTHRRGFVGAIVAPEVLQRGEDAHPVPLTVAIDVFALAVLIHCMAAPPKTLNPFWYPQTLPTFEKRSKEDNFTEVFAQFEAWKKTVTDPKTQRVTAGAILASKPHFFRALFAPLASFNAVLSECLLNDAMAQEPHRRPKAADLAQMARYALPYNDPCMHDLRAIMNALAHSPQNQDIRRKAALYSERERALRACIARGAAPVTDGDRRLGLEGAPTIGG